MHAYLTLRWRLGHLEHYLYKEGMNRFLSHRNGFSVRKLHPNGPAIIRIVINPDHFLFRIPPKVSDLIVNDFKQVISIRHIGDTGVCEGNRVQIGMPYNLQFKRITG